MNYLQLTKQIVLKYIDPKKHQVFLFGSRAFGNEKFYSDIDVGIISVEPINSITMADLESELEESIIPYKVDIVDFSKVSKEFKSQALQKIVRWN